MRLLLVLGLLAGFAEGPWVQDGAKILTTEEREALHQELRTMPFHVGVLTVDSLQGATGEAVAKRALAGPGSERSVVILLAMEEHAIRVQRGAGLADVFPQEATDRVVRSMQPSFKRGEWYAGLRHGTGTLEGIWSAYQGTAVPVSGGITQAPEDHSARNLLFAFAGGVGFLVLGAAAVAFVLDGRRLAKAEKALRKEREERWRRQETPSSAGIHNPMPSGIARPPAPPAPPPRPVNAHISYSQRPARPVNAPRQEVHHHHYETPSPVVVVAPSYSAPEPSYSSSSDSGSSYSSSDSGGSSGGFDSGSSGGGGSDGSW